MTYYIDPTNEIFGFDDTQKNLIPSDAVAIPNKYTPDQYAFLSLTGGKIVFDSAAYNAATQTNTIAQYNLAAQNQLDSIAISWGYDNMISAVSYAKSNNTQYSAEGTALSDWRDALWSKAYTIEAGTLPATVNDFLAQLPVAPVRPTI